jgi:hypothetical protein
MNLFTSDTIDEERKLYISLLVVYVISVGISVDTACSFIIASGYILLRVFCPALVFLFYLVGAGTTVRVLRRREGFTLSPERFPWPVSVPNGCWHPVHYS